MDGTGLDPTAARAQAGHVQLTVGAKAQRAWASFVRAMGQAPDWLRRNLPVALLVGAWAGIFVWEAINTAAGAARTWPEREGFQTAMVGFACTLGFMMSFRVGMEAVRAKEVAKAVGFFLVTAIMFVVVGFLTFSNFVAETQVTGQAAREINTDRQDLRDKIRRLDRELTSMPEPLSLEGDRELLKSRLAEAEGWGMANLDPEGACKADLKTRQRFLCNDAATIRDDIIRGEAMLEAKNVKRAEVEAAEALLETMKLQEAGAQYDAMAAMANGKVSAEFLSSWALLIVSILLLVAGAIFGDYLLERREKKEA